MSRKPIGATLNERGNNYGEYTTQSALSQEIKAVFAGSDSFSRLLPFHRESLDMIANKLARILNGDPMYADSWHDIAGYATLVVNELEKIDKIQWDEIDLEPDCGPGSSYVNQD